MRNPAIWRIANNNEDVYTILMKQWDTYQNFTNSTGLTEDEKNIVRDGTPYYANYFE